jgi:hypothetical protein
MFAEMPLDNRAEDRFAALAATSGFSGRFEIPSPTRRLNVSSWLIVL